MCDGQDKSGAASMAAAHTPATGPPDEQRRAGFMQPTEADDLIRSTWWRTTIRCCVRHSSLLTPDPEPAESSHFQLPILRPPRL